MILICKIQIPRPLESTFADLSDCSAILTANIISYDAATEFIKSTAKV